MPIPERDPYPGKPTGAAMPLVWPLGLGLHGVRLEPALLAARRLLDFTRRDPAAERWEGADHTIHLDEPH